VADSLGFVDAQERTLHDICLLLILCDINSENSFTSWGLLSSA